MRSHSLYESEFCEEVTILFKKIGGLNRNVNMISFDIDSVMI